MLEEVNSTELVDLRSSVKGIKISGLKRLAEVALTFAEEKLHGKTKDSMGLNQNEIAAINLYTRDGLHKLMNEDLRGDKLTRARPYFKYVKLLQTALFKLPPFENAMAYRAVKSQLPNDYYRKNTVFFSRGFDSYSLSFESAIQFAGGNGATCNYAGRCWKENQRIFILCI